MTNLGEEPDALRNGEPVIIAVVRDPDSADQFHDEVRASALRGSGIENLRDVRMIHHRQSLALLFESGDDLFGIETWLDDLERYSPAHRSLLVGHPHRAEAALAQLLEKFVIADQSASLLAGNYGLRGTINPCHRIAKKDRGF